MTNITMENHHWNSEFSHEKWWFSIVMLVYQRVIIIVWLKRLYSHYNYYSHSSSYDNYNYSVLAHHMYIYICQPWNSWYTFQFVTENLAINESCKISWLAGCVFVAPSNVKNLVMNIWMSVHQEIAKDLICLVKPSPIQEGPPWRIRRFRTI